MYTAKNRMDQGVGLVLAALEASGRANDTLVIYFADNGAPFAAGKTNLLNPGMAEPLIISRPGGAAGVRSTALASELDLMPTILEWMGVPAPAYRLNGVPVVLQGRSLLPLLDSAVSRAPDVHTQVTTAAGMAARVRHPTAPRPLPSNYTRIFGSFQFHEEQMYFPMRVVVASDDAAGAPTFRYKLIYNIAHFLPYPIAQDLWDSPSFADLETNNAAGAPTHWYRNFTTYLSPRSKWELFDLIADPQELTNLAADPAFADVFAALAADIKAWQKVTDDDWVIKYTHE